MKKKLTFLAIAAIAAVTVAAPTDAHAGIFKKIGSKLGRYADNVGNAVVVGPIKGVVREAFKPPKKVEQDRDWANGGTTRQPTTQSQSRRVYR